MKLTISILVFSVLLAACDSEPHPSSTLAEGDAVVVTVNGESVVTKYQLAAAVADMKKEIIGADKKDLEQLAVKRLIEYQLMMEQALEKGVDQNPTVAYELKNTYRQILAKAYFNQLAKQIMPATDKEIQDYYQKHPELFSERRIYQMKGFLLANPADFQQASKLYAQSNSLAELAKKLKAESIKYGVDNLTQPAEGLPADNLAKLFQLKKGEVIVLEKAGILSFVELTDFHEQAISEAKARPFIAKRLLDERRKALYDAELLKLAAQAKIEFASGASEIAEDKANAMPNAAPSSSGAGLQSYAE